MAEQTRTILVKGVVEGDRDIKRMANSLNELSKSSKEMSSSFSGVKSMFENIFGAAILGIGIRELASLADSMTQLNSKLNIFVGEGKKASDAFQRLVDIANETKAPLTGVATIFTRIATATERLNLSTDLQLGLTKILQQSFRVSGATAEEATASTIQFAQALSFGQLRGQELRSVLSQNSALATIFGKAIEGSGKDIYKFAEAGGFTTKFVLKALFDNMAAIEEKAGKLSQTFEQSLTLAMNAFTVKVKELNEALGLSEGFAKFIDYILKNGDAVAQILISIGATALPLLVAGIRSVTAAMLANPFGLIAVGISSLTYLAIEASGGLKQFLNELVLLPFALAQLGISILEQSPILHNFVDFLVRLGSDTGEGLQDIKKSLNGFIKDSRQAADAGSKAIASLAPQKSLADLQKEISNIAVKTTMTVKEQIGALSALFNTGKIGVDEYVKKLNTLETQELTSRLKKGEIGINEFNEKLNQKALEGFSLLLENGAIKITEFNRRVNEFQIDRLEEKFKKGRLTLEQYTEQLNKLKIAGMDQNSWMTGLAKGMVEFVDSIGTTAQNFSNLTVNAFKNFEDAIYSATKSGRLDFATMTQGILDDLTKIAIRMAIVKPLAEGLLGGLFGPSTAAPGGQVAGATPVAQPFAMGGMFSGGIQKYADGGVVSSPTYFGLSQNKLGVMGEAGPEAIVPLRRSSNGSLGVAASPTVININNTTNSEVTASQRTNSDGSKSIDVFIKAKVREAIVNGDFDKQLDQSFALKRRGV